MIFRLWVILLISALQFSCSNEKVKPKINTTIKVEELPAQESWNSKVVFSDSGKLKAVLLTGHLRVFTEAQQTLLDSGLQVDFYDEEQIKTTTLTSLKGRVEDATQNLYAIDSVVAINDSGVVIKTDELMWRNLDKKIISDKYVIITSQKEKIEGYGFESDQSLRNYVIRDIKYITRTDSTETSR